MSSFNYRGGILIEHWDDDALTYTRWSDDGTEVIETRPYNDDEMRALLDEAQNNALASLDERVAALEAWRAEQEQVTEPAEPTPEDESIKDWTAWGGVWPHDTLLRDGGKVWRNKSGVPLTTPPSGFPGSPDQWTHLFVEVGTTPPPDPDPDRPEGYVGTWSSTATYAVGDVVDRDGTYYRCKAAHGPEYQGTWGPPQASVWDVVGPV